MNTQLMSRQDIEQWLLLRYPNKDISTLFRFLELSGTIVSASNTTAGTYYVIDKRFSEEDVNLLNSDPNPGDIVISFDTGLYLVLKKYDNVYIEAVSVKVSNRNTLSIIPQPPRKLAISDIFVRKHSSFNMNEVNDIINKLTPELEIISQLWNDLISCREEKE